MKQIYLLTCFVIMMITFTKAQGFVRVYNTKGDKISKGHFVDSSSTDSALVIKRGETFDTISVLKVSYIKTKHSIGNNILIGAAISAPLFAIIGAATGGDCYDCLVVTTPAQDAVAGFVVGAIAGATVGAITGAFKNSKTIHINGDIQKWHQVRMMLVRK
jgi:hypothetical protein